MLIQEYQAKRILKALGIQTPEGYLAESPEQIIKICKALGSPAVLKAQILSGGRGQAGGILLAREPEEAESLARNLFGKRLITSQTGNRGLVVRKILVEKALNIKKECYLGLAVDREHETLLALVSREGGIQIEELSRQKPELIKIISFNPDEGMRPFQARQLAYFLELEEDLIKQLVSLLRNLSGFFIEKDLKLLEVNPLVLTESRLLVAADVKMEFDDCSLERHQDISGLLDFSDDSEEEMEARNFKLNYLRMEGNIGCLVNGAGLAMATMDIISHFGGQPANFLDIGGGVTEEAVNKAFEILISDDRVTSALVNIFGGIVRCDLVARGVVNCAERLGLKKPVVVRMEGTNVIEGQKILKESGLPFHLADDFEQAARLVVSLSGREK
ncbi:MAG: ADP-forming succinate--CoA ligase subunit beta [Acidobacteriota bacterium]|nr:ADP-forming succinate--CoA ligase subunit beta [Acidobacteriota bacterium]MDW3228539.1 ADP-forming succinate--CoA ligase subunit beta [Acidobacteriota bacterium]